jgi:hypothetical protein
LNPRTRVPEASTLTARPPKPLTLIVTVPLHSFLSLSKYFQVMLQVTFFSQLHLILNNYFSVLLYLKFLWGFLGYIVIHTLPLTTHIFLPQIFLLFIILIIIVSVLHSRPPKHEMQFFHLIAAFIPLKFQTCCNHNISLRHFLLSHKSNSLFSTSDTNIFLKCVI